MNPDAARMRRDGPCEDHGADKFGMLCEERVLSPVDERRCKLNGVGDASGRSRASESLVGPLDESPGRNEETPVLSFASAVRVPGIEAGVRRASDAAPCARPQNPGSRP